MAQSVNPPTSDHDQRLERAIAGYLEDVAQGKSVNTERLISEHPDIADDLRQFFDDHERIARVANSSIARNEQGDNRPDAPTCVHSSDNTPNRDQTISISPSLFTSGPVNKLPGALVGQFGDYELLHEVARGGMGVVYKARQVSLNRVVAIKMILRGNLAGREDIERFALEAKAVARLTHPQIVVIHDVGQYGDQHFYTMEFVEGRSLADLIRSGPVAPRKAAEYVEQVAKAIHFAHQNGVVHRDIKPSNVLIDESGRARVTDFGLAKHVDRGEELTLSGEILGTPAYMAPEQITNRRGEIGPACDIYGMGVLLYELMTARVPFKGRDQFDTLLQVLDCEPQSPRKINSNVPRELEMICFKCMDKDPQRRYASASELADDLAHYLAGDSISLTSPKLVDRLVRTLERSQFDREFFTWSRMLLHLAWISLATHVMIYFNRALDPPHPLVNLIGIRVFELLGMGAVLLSMRSRWFPPRGAPARQLLSLWLGYMIGSTALVVIAYLLTRSGTRFNELVAYPPMAVLASLLFMMLGASYWGYCYVMGSVFLVLSIVMTFWLPAAPLIFGAAWAASLSILSLRLSHLAGKS
jgi:serine/threonine protein kinase